MDEAVEPHSAKFDSGMILKISSRTAQHHYSLSNSKSFASSCLLPLKPRIILMDEPCSALDVDGTRAVEELMVSLADDT